MSDMSDRLNAALQGRYRVERLLGDDVTPLVDPSIP